MTKPGKNKKPRVVLGVTGSIAAYKSPLIVRGLVKAGHPVRCVLTKRAKDFVSPLVLSALSQNPVVSDYHDPSLWEMAHLTLADWADIVLIAPATADTIARLAAGRAQELLDSLVLSTKARVALAPAMDVEMWEHPATRANVERLKGYGYEIWGPARGELASGRIGWGRLLDVTDLVSRCASKKSK